MPTAVLSVATPLLYAESNTREGPTVMWQTEGNSSSRDQVRTPPPHLANYQAPLTTLTQHVNDEGERTTSTTANDECKRDSDTSNNGHHKCKRQRQTRTRCPQHPQQVRTPIGEGGGWFSMVSEITTAVPIPHCSQGDKFLYIWR